MWIDTTTNQKSQSCVHSHDSSTADNKKENVQ